MALFSIFSAKADIMIDNIEIIEMRNHIVKIGWHTNEATKGFIYFGKDKDNLNRTMGYSLYDYNHELSLNNIDKNEDYYFKIRAITESGEESETVIQKFSTDDMEDTEKPEFEEQKFLQATQSGVAITWETDEKTKGTIHYGPGPYNLVKKAKSNRYKTRHALFIYRLSPGSQYYFQIVAKDRAGNERNGQVMSFYTLDKTDNPYKLEIANINTNVQERSIIMTWRTSLASQAYLYYGTSPNKVRSKIKVSKYPKLLHKYTLDGLKPNKTYYFKIKGLKSLHKKKAESMIFSVKTKPLETELPIGTLIKGSTQKVYIIQGDGTKAWIQNEEIFTGLKFKWHWIKNINDEALSEYEEIDNISSSKKHPNGVLIKYEGKPGVYLLENGKKRPFFTEKAFTRKGYDWSRVIIVKKKYKTGKNLY